MVVWEVLSSFLSPIQPPFEMKSWKSKKMTVDAFFVYMIKRFGDCGFSFEKVT